MLHDTYVVAGNEACGLFIVKARRMVFAGECFAVVQHLCAKKRAQSSDDLPLAGISAEKAFIDCERDALRL